MTPKEKADELCKKMLYQIEWNAEPSTVKGVAKECALIAVDEILKVAFYSTDKIYNYYIEVEQEIENL